MSVDFVSVVDGVMYFKGKDKEMVAYIPEKYFDRNIAEIQGEYIELLGIFNYTIQDLKTGKNNGLKLFKFPTVFTTHPSSVETVKQIKLISNSEIEDYKILRYRDGDEIMTSTDVVQFIGNAEKLMTLFYILGYVNNTIPYDKIHEYILDNASLNKFGYGLNYQMIGFTISELCRSKDDPHIPFRLSKTNDMHAYKSMSVKNISKLTSPYTALISEDFDESLLYAMMNETPRDTPLEKILVGEN